MFTTDKRHPIADVSNMADVIVIFGGRLNLDRCGIYSAQHPNHNLTQALRCLLTPISRKTMKMSNSIQVENIEHGKSLFVSISACLSNRKRLGKFNDLIKLLSGLKEKLDTAETDS